MTNKGLFITATGTDIGKTYLSALLVKAIRDAGYNCGYYKAAVSGADSIAASDAGYVNQTANIGQKESTLLSYLYKTPVSPHLASRLEGNPLSIEQVKLDYKVVCHTYSHIIVEGSGGIVCPLRWDDTTHIMLEDVIKELNLPTLVAASSGLGTINATVLTIRYLQNCFIAVKGVILNQYTGTDLQEDNRQMIEELTGIPVIAVVKPDAADLNIEKTKLLTLFEQ